MPLVHTIGEVDSEPSAVNVNLDRGGPPLPPLSKEDLIMTTLVTNLFNGVQVLSAQPYTTDAASGPGIVKCDQVKTGSVSSSGNITSSTGLVGLDLVATNSATVGTLQVNTYPVKKMKLIKTITKAQLIAMNPADGSTGVEILGPLTDNNLWKIENIALVYKYSTSAYAISGTAANAVFSVYYDTDMTMSITTLQAYQFITDNSANTLSVSVKTSPLIIGAGAPLNLNLVDGAAIRINLSGESVTGLTNAGAGASLYVFADYSLENFVNQLPS
jgi:hypothetical protein